jgi:transposase
MYHNLSPELYPAAVFLWNKGWDTLEIAKSLRVHESVIYNGLPKWRKEFHELQARTI